MVSLSGARIGAILTLCDSFFEISIGGKKEGRIIFELFADVVPRTADKYDITRFAARQADND